MRFPHGAIPFLPHVLADEVMRIAYMDTFCAHAALTTAQTAWPIKKRTRGSAPAQRKKQAP